MGWGRCCDRMPSPYSLPLPTYLYTYTLQRIYHHECQLWQSAGSFGGTVSWAGSVGELHTGPRAASKMYEAPPKNGFARSVSLPGIDLPWPPSTKRHHQYKGHVHGNLVSFVPLQLAMGPWGRGWRCPGGNGASVCEHLVPHTAPRGPLPQPGTVQERVSHKAAGCGEGFLPCSQRELRVSRIMAAAIFLNLEGNCLDTRCFIACLKHPPIFFKFHATKVFFFQIWTSEFRVVAVLG